MRPNLTVIAKDGYYPTPRNVHQAQPVAQAERIELATAQARPRRPSPPAAVIAVIAPALSANILLALAAAASWGGGDFSGGMGVKAAGGTHARGAAGGDDCACRQPGGAAGDTGLEQRPDLLPQRCRMERRWRGGLVAGVAAGISLTAFYIALARGAMGARRP